MNRPYSSWNYALSKLPYLEIQEEKKGALLQNKSQVCHGHLLKRLIDQKFWASVSDNIIYMTASTKLAEMLV